VDALTVIAVTEQDHRKKHVERSILPSQVIIDHAFEMPCSIQKQVVADRVGLEHGSGKAAIDCLQLFSVLMKEKKNLFPAR